MPSIFSNFLNLVRSSKLLEITSRGDHPTARQGHCAAAYGEEMIVFGGRNDVGVFNDLYVFDMKYVDKE